MLMSFLCSPQNVNVENYLMYCISNVTVKRTYIVKKTKKENRFDTWRFHAIKLFFQQSVNRSKLFKMFPDHATIGSLYNEGIFETSTGTTQLLLPPIEWRQFVIR